MFLYSQNGRHMVTMNELHVLKNPKTGSFEIHHYGMGLDTPVSLAAYKDEKASDETVLLY